METTKEVTDPTCTKEGSITYRAVFTYAAFIAQTKTVAGAKAFGHDFQNDICTRCNARRTGAWVRSGSRWWYRYSDGTYPANELRKIGNSWFGFDAAGWMEKRACKSLLYLLIPILNIFTVANSFMFTCH